MKSSGGKMSSGGGGWSGNKENSKSLLHSNSKSILSSSAGRIKAKTSASQSRDEIKNKAATNSKMMLLSDSDSDGNDGLIFSDEDTVTSNRKGNKDDSMNKDSGNIEELKGGDEGVEEIKKKARNTAKPFTEDILCGADGLTRLYEAMGDPMITFKTALKNGPVRGSEANDIKRLMLKYTEWAHQLYPGLAFTDLVGKCEDLSSKGRVKSELDKLRDRERCRYLVDVMGVSRENILIQSHDNNSKKTKTSGDMTSPEQLSSPDYMKQKPGHVSALQRLNDDGDFDYDLFQEAEEAVDKNNAKSSSSSSSSLVPSAVIDEDDYEAEFEAAMHASRSNNTFHDDGMVVSQRIRHDADIDDLLFQLAEEDEARRAAAAAAAADSLPMSQDLPSSYSYNSCAADTYDDFSQVMDDATSSSKRMSIEEHAAADTQSACDMSVCIDAQGAPLEEAEADHMVESCTQADDYAASQMMDVDRQ